MQNRHLIDLSDLSVAEWEEITALASDIRRHMDDYYGVCRGKILATLFYEPSTRTQMSFQTAMLRLGGRIIGFDNPGNSSVAKGETIKDTVRVVSGYSDIIAMRHPTAGAALAAALYSRVPVINAGDGGHLHPTQTLTDLTTLRNEKGTFSGFVHRPVRRSEKRTDGAFPYQGHVPLPWKPVRADLHPSSRYSPLHQGLFGGGGLSVAGNGQLGRGHASARRTVYDPYPAGTL